MPFLTSLKLPSMRKISEQSSAAAISRLTSCGSGMDLTSVAGHLKRDRLGLARDLEGIKSPLEGKSHGGIQRVFASHRQGLVAEDHMFSDPARRDEDRHLIYTLLRDDDLPL